MSANALLQLSRKIHLYLGLFISPMLLFFAFTGAVQTLGYHEASANYHPPALLASLGQIHKKQTYTVPVRRGPGEAPRPANSAPASAPATTPDTTTHRHGGASGAPNQPAAASAQTITPDAAPARAQAPRDAQGRPGGQQPLTLQAKQRQHLALKVFFVLVSLGLFTSTLTGIYMAYRYDRNRWLVTGLLVAGVVTPILLVRP